jgi:hypothetical protein
LKINLNPQNVRVFLLGDFNVPGFNWENRFPQANSHYYIKIRRDVVHSAACYLGLSQYNLTFQNKNLLHLVFANFSCINVTISNSVRRESFRSYFIFTFLQCTPQYKYGIVASKSILKLTAMARLWSAVNL